MLNEELVLPQKLLVICENSNSLTEGYISIQAQVMKSLGWDVSFLCCEGGGVGVKHIGGFSTVYTPCSNLIKPVTVSQRIKKFVRTYSYSNSELASSDEIVSWKNKISDISPDIILVQFGTMAAKILPALISFTGTWVVHFHGFDITERCGHWGYRRTLQHLLKVAPAVVGCSNFVVDRLTKYASSDNDRIYVVSPGYDETRYKYQRSEVIPSTTAIAKVVKFISVARLAEGKGHDITIRALARLEIDWVLTIIGGGPQQSCLIDLSKELGIENQVHIVGAQTPEQIRHKLFESDVFVQSSRRAESGWIEGLGLSSLEAAATGLPVIVSNSGGLGETCAHNETGFVYPEGDLDQLEMALRRLCLDSTLRKKMGDAGANWVKKKYSSEVQGRKLDAIMRKLLM